MFASILWASSFVSIKIGLSYVNPFNFVFLRIAFAAAVLLPLLILRGRFSLAVLTEGSIWVLGLFNGIAYALQYVGMLFTTAAKTALLVNLNVIVIAILSRWLFQESFGKRKQAGVLLGVAGAVMITTGGDLSVLARGQFLGDALVLLAGFSWAIFSVLHKRLILQKDQDVIRLSTVVMIATATLLLPIALILGGLPSTSMPIEGWELIVYTAIACTILPYAMWIVALKAVTVTVASVVGLLEILGTMIMSFYLLGESYNAITLVGAALVLFALFAVAEN